MSAVLSTALNVIPGVVYWAWNKMSKKEIGKVNPIAVCGLFALIPVLPSRTRFGIVEGGKVVVQLEKPICTIPIVGVTVTEQAINRGWNGDNRDEIRFFEEAIKLVNRDYGKNRLVQQLLKRTADGVRAYAENYKSTDLAFGNLKSLAEILERNEKEAKPYRPIGLASILDLEDKIAELTQRLVLKEEEAKDEKSLEDLIKEIAVLVDGSGLKENNYPIDRDRMEAIVRHIEHVFDRVVLKAPCGPELSAALAYLNCIQEDESDIARRNQNLEVPT